MAKPIYPKIEIRETEATIELFTTLRKKHRGKWYLWEFYQKYLYRGDKDKQKVQLIERLHQEVYFIIITGKISNKIVDMNGSPLFRKDQNQISESERIKGLLNLI